jgi:DNA-directed RNA polymerase subunit RPC12/RpoP
MARTRTQGSCHDCGAEVGDIHMDNCDTERCPYCGRQALMCWNTVTDEDLSKLTIEHKETQNPKLLKKIKMIIDNGEDETTVADCCDEIVKDSDRMPWTGIWPGVAECQEYGLWSKMGPKGWEKCDKDDPEASEDLNRLTEVCKWDRKLKKWALKGKK